MEPTPVAAKKKSERREDLLTIRLTEAEQRRLAEVARLFSTHTKSIVVRAALMAGLDIIEAKGITIAPTKPRR